MLLYMWNMVRIGFTASEDTSFENVDDGRRTDGRMPAFGSGELKMIFKICETSLNIQKGGAHSTNI